MTAQDTNVVEAQRAWERWLRTATTPKPRVLTALETAAAATEELGRRLAAKGYPVSKPRILPSPSVLANLAALEASTGKAVPPQLRLFWSTVGGIRFMDYDSYRHAEYWSERGCGGLTDALTVDPLTDDFAEYLAEEHDNWLEEEGSGRANEGLFELTLSPDALHKDNISGGIPYSMAASDQWGEPLLFDGWNENVVSQPTQNDLVSYLRTGLLECAGFPGLRGDPAFESARPSLVAGLPVF